MTEKKPAGRQEPAGKKEYEKPAIVHSEFLMGRAVTCARQDNASCPSGPITS